MSHDEQTAWFKWMSTCKSFQSVCKPGEWYEMWGWRNKEWRNQFCNTHSIQGSNGGGNSSPLLPDGSARDIASCGRKTCSHSGSIRLMMFSKEIVHVDAVHRKLKMLRYVEWEFAYSEVNQTRLDLKMSVLHLVLQSLHLIRGSHGFWTTLVPGDFFSQRLDK